MLLANFLNPLVKRSTTVTEDINDTRLDYYIARRFPYYSRTEWQAIIECGLLIINDKNVSYKKKIKKNDKITYFIFYYKEPEVQKNVKIIYDDDDLIIVSKPANLPVIPAGKYYYNTLYKIACDKLNYNLKLLHRLDRETSGCVAFSRTKEMARGFCHLIKTHAIKKIYIAIVENASDIEDRFTVEGYMKPSPNQYYRQYQTLTENDGKYSKTKFKVLSKHGQYAILLCRIYTGRMHQIRVHLYSLGIFIIGDKIYGREGPLAFDRFLNPSNYKDKEEMFDRQALHSYKLIFNHPKTNEKIRVVAKIEDDMKLLIKQLNIPFFKNRNKKKL